jgi:hypothetical protein
MIDDDVAALYYGNGIEARDAHAPVLCFENCADQSSTRDTIGDVPDEWGEAQCEDLKPPRE